MSATGLALGTAALAQPYAGQNPPDADAAVRLIVRAIDDGVRVIDTAPDYGSEELVGRACRLAEDDVTIVTKVSPKFTLNQMLASLNESRRRLGRSPDGLLLHSANLIQLHGAPSAALHMIKGLEGVRWIGASVYSREEALAALSNELDIIQIPFSLIDQRMADLVAEHPERFMLRSLLMRGALANGEASQSLAVNKARFFFGRSLPEVAIRFAIEKAWMALIGVRTEQEWEAARRAWDKGPLGWLRSKAASWCRDDAADLRTWT